MKNLWHFVHIAPRWGKKALFTLLFGQLFFGIDAYAQAVIPRPTVTRAIDVFESNPERFVVGNRLAFKVRATTVAQRIMRSGLQVRVFALRDDQARPSPITTIDDCDVYISVVLRIQSPSATEAVTQTLDHSWLSLTDSLNSIVPRRYFLVFEQSGPDLEQFRLKRFDYESYFSTGFSILVDKQDGISIEAVRSAYFESRDKLGRLRLEIDERKSSVPCYTYRRLVAETPAETQIAHDRLALCNASYGAETTM